MHGPSRPVVDGQRRGETRTLVATTATAFRLWEYLWEMDYRKEGKSEVLGIMCAVFDAIFALGINRAFIVPVQNCITSDEIRERNSQH
jgi:hypothetical protein